MTSLILIANRKNVFGEVYIGSQRLVKIEEEQ